MVLPLTMAHADSIKIENNAHQLPQTINYPNQLTIRHGAKYFKFTVLNSTKWKEIKCVMPKD